MISTPVIWKKRRMLKRWLPWYTSHPSPVAAARPSSVPATTSPSPLSVVVERGTGPSRGPLAARRRRPRRPAPRLTAGEGPGGLAFQLTLQRAGVGAHPEDHPRQQAGGGDADHRERAQPGDALEPIDRRVQDEPDDRSEDRGRRRTDPHPASLFGPFAAARTPARWRRSTPPRSPHGGQSESSRPYVKHA